MKLTTDQLTSIKLIMEQLGYNNPKIPLLFQKVSTVHIKGTYKYFTIEYLTLSDINEYYGLRYSDNGKPILTLTYADHDSDLECMYDVNQLEPYPIPIVVRYGGITRACILKLKI